MEGNELKRLIDRLSGAFLTRKEGVTSCRAYNSAAVSIADATGTYLALDSESFDETGMHSTSTNTGRITITMPGVYLIQSGHTWAPSTAGDRYSAIILNRTSVLCATYVTAGNHAAIPLSSMWRFTSTDYIESYVYQSSGGALNIGGTGITAIDPKQWLSAARIA